MKKKNFITGLLGIILAVYSFTAYRTLHSLKIFFVSNTIGKIYAYTYLVCGILGAFLLLSFVLSVVKAVRKRKNPQREEQPVPAADVQAEKAEKPVVEIPQPVEAAVQPESEPIVVTVQPDETPTGETVPVPEDIPRETELADDEPADENMTEID